MDVTYQSVARIQLYEASSKVISVREMIEGCSPEECAARNNLNEALERLDRANELLTGG